MVKIATFNVNSIKVRLPLLLEWLDAAQPDILCLQEIKCPAADFPLLELRGRGYHAEIVGERSYNGVALIAREPLRDVLTVLPGDAGDQQARFLEATIGDLRVASLYFPNGNPVGSEKFAYKLAWMARLRAHAQELLESETAFVLAGDYNVAPTDDDVFDAAYMQNDAVCQTEARREFRALVNLGLIDAYRACHAEPHRYTFWDYQAGRWYRDEGVRIDHLLLSPQAADRLEGAEIDKAPRGKDKASDHTPIWCSLGPRRRLG